ncbi:sensor histidine kinase [Alkalihalobacillus sp. BA299]|uniref:sensor histidine kinase n=1 Tax=Alkalihalobacillus sp. BA299 TaxID=2815938 RepID=UPI001FFE0F9D|nr:ATP-binding protein [Alkalihalobacillus sp. BA299]
MHDGIAQSFFLLSVRMNQLEKSEKHLKENEIYQKVKKTVQHVHDDVRQAIFNLKHSEVEQTFDWNDSLSQLISNFKQDTRISITFDWQINEKRLTPKEKIELFACLKEALMNVQKHSQAQAVWVTAKEIEHGWICKIEDDGIGFTSINNKEGSFGLDIMKDRVNKMDWILSISCDKGKTKVEIRKEKKI